MRIDKVRRTRGQRYIHTFNKRMFTEALHSADIYYTLNGILGRGDEIDVARVHKARMLLLLLETSIIHWMASWPAETNRCRSCPQDKHLLLLCVKNVYASRRIHNSGMPPRCSIRSLYSILVVRLSRSSCLYLCILGWCRRGMGMNSPVELTC